MRITITRKPAVCPICKKELEIGKPAASFMFTMSALQRGHIECITNWRNASIELTKISPGLQ